MANHPRRPHRGRGAVSNPTGRFESHQREHFDDGWGALDEAEVPVRTTLHLDTSRTVIARNDSPDVGFDRSLNPYRGCEHGCVYCFARPTHTYLGFSAGLDFETEILHKPDAASRLRAEIARPGYRCAMIALGTNTDPYQPVERDLRITRSVLEVLRDARHPVGIVTKGTLVLRDIDILAEMAASNLCRVFLSVTSLDRTLARRMEPRAATPERRLETIAALRDAGVPVGVMVAPIIPGLTDPDLETILTRARDAGADVASKVLLRLPGEVAELFPEWLERHYPEKASRVMGLLREMRGGKNYDPRFGVRMRGQGPFADLLDWRFRTACRRLGYAETVAALTTSLFVPPPRPPASRSGGGGQLDLFDDASTPARR
jgi:DNA repair photolyase